MRTAPRWFLRRAHQLFPSNSSATITLSKTPTNVVSHPNLRPLSASRLSPCVLSCARRLIHTDASVPTASIAANDEFVAASADVVLRESPVPPSLSRWMRQVNKYLPATLRISLSEEPSPQEDASHLPIPLSAKLLEKILTRAKSEEDTDVLLWLVENDHRKTAVWLMETILNYPSAKKKTFSTRPPSNIDWPQDLFAAVRDVAIDVPSVTRPVLDLVSNEDDFEPARYESREVEAQHRLVSRVWKTLGVLIIKSAAAAKGDTIDDSMLTALLVLGHIHNLGLMPDDVYAYNHLNRPTFVQRPPILNLVSSRILTALSDVAWRQQQDDAIVQAANMGMSLKEISRTVPGGRFRLKVRPLGPEIWLELILWCCIESNQTTAALAIVKRLAAESEEPWFAVRWTSSQPREKLSTLIDWDRMKLRHGGSSGLIEGYSREKPFVDVPEKTISVEVVLALVEKLIVVGLSSSITNVSKLAAPTIHKDFRSLQKTMADIEDALTFLEPHDLPIGYFDYLESRLLQDDAFDVFRAPADLYTWSTRMKSIRDLQKYDAEKSFGQTLGVEDIYAHSQLHIGFQQQAMTALVQFGDVHHTLAVFNEIQEAIDKVKVASITDFLQQMPAVSTRSIVSSQPNYELEFTNCHGQLPYHKLAGLLNLISDTKLIGLGRWLLYADDVDGATLSAQARDQPCMTAALYKFAAVSQDEHLLKATVPLKHFKGWRPTVNMLRARCDANAALSQWDSARNDLRQLKFAAGGGYSLSNIVHVAATVLRLEHSNSDVRQERLTMAKDTLNNMLLGTYASNRSDFTVAQRRLFRQQIRSILRVFATFDRSILSEFAQSFGFSFRSTNLPVLPAKLFNVLLSAAVDTRGSAFGEKLWNRFCKIPDTPWAAELVDLGVESLRRDEELDTFAASDSPIDSGLSILNSEETESQQHQSGPADESIEFEDPYFPKRLSKPERSPSLHKDKSLVPSKDTYIHFDPAVGHDFKILPLTLPNLHTLRLIVRAVAVEMKDREDSGLGTKAHKRQIAWAVEMFKAFGIVDRTIVEQEVEYPLDELDASVLKESEEMIEAARQREKYKLEMNQDMVVGLPISPMWVA